jgi:hypothetical protein
MSSLPHTRLLANCAEDAYEPPWRGKPAVDVDFDTTDGEQFDRGVTTTRARTDHGHGHRQVFGHPDHGSEVLFDRCQRRASLLVLSIGCHVFMRRRRQRIMSVDRVERALLGAQFAVDARRRIDIERLRRCIIGLVRSRMDAVGRTDRRAHGITATRARDYVGIGNLGWMRVRRPIDEPMVIVAFACRWDHTGLTVEAQMSLAPQSMVKTARITSPLSKSWVALLTSSSGYTRVINSSSLNRPAW